MDLGTAGDRVYSIAMGESHACAIVENTIECWGVEESGQGSILLAHTVHHRQFLHLQIDLKQIVIEHSTDSTCGTEDTAGASTVICW